MCLNCTWEMLICKSEFEPVLTEVLAIPAYGTSPSPKVAKSQPF